MKNKKLALLAVLCLATAMTTAIAGCKKKQPQQNTPVDSTYEVSFPNETLMLVVGDESALVADYAYQEGLSLTYTSSDESVVKVDEYGRLVALKEGTATITVRYGEASDSCLVTVTMNGLLPLLQLPNVPMEEISMTKSSELDLSGTVLFNEKTFTDVELSYELSDETVGKIENGVFVPLKTGATEIYVKGTWRGCSAQSLTKMISITVIPERFFAVNDGISEVTLYTQNNTTSPFVVTVEYDNVALPSTVDVTSGSEYVRYDAEKQTLVSRGRAGEAEVTISYEVDGELLTKVIPVYVKPTIYSYAKTVENFSAIHGDVAKGKTLKAILGGNILSAYAEDGSALEVKDNKVYGVESSNDGEFQTEITICTDTHGYTLEIEGYSGIFAKAEDFSVFNINLQYGYTDEQGNSIKEFVPVDASKPMQVWEGYYILLNNIDASDYTHSCGGVTLHSRGIQSGYPYGFYGTFDGQGYTVKGMTIQAYGLFGYVNDATIKDVAFVDVTLDSSVNYSTTLASWINHSTVSNVYISIANEGAYAMRAAGFAGGVNLSTIAGCVVETKETLSFKSSSKASGAFTYLNKEVLDGDADVSRFVDVYVVTTAHLGYYESSNAYALAENDTFVVPEGGRGYTLEGVKKFATVAEMQAAGNTYTAFSASCWSMESGAPVWKSVNGEYPSADDLIIDEIPEKGSDGDFNVDWL